MNRNILIKGEPDEDSDDEVIFPDIEETFSFHMVSSPKQDDSASSDSDTISNENVSKDEMSFVNQYGRKMLIYQDYLFDCTIGRKLETKCNWICIFKSCKAFIVEFHNGQFDKRGVHSHGPIFDGSIKSPLTQQSQPSSSQFNSSNRNLFYFPWEKEQQHLKHLLAPLLSDSEDEGKYDAIPIRFDENNFIEHSDHSSESEQDAEEVLEQDSVLNVKSHLSYFLGKNKKTKWYKKKGNSSIHIQSPNIAVRLPGAKGAAKSCKGPVDFFKLFLSDGMIEDIVKFTNIFIESIRGNFSRERDCKVTNIAEMSAFIGLVVLAGLFKSSHRKFRDLWNTSRLGIGVFQKTMSYNRFTFLLRCICFDNVLDRNKRKSLDKFTHFRDIFSQFNENAVKYYSASENVTIDEQLLQFMGSCPFLHFMPKKPGKFGIKLFALCDAKTFYTLKLEPYIGKQPKGPFKNSYTTSDIVMRLSESLYGSCRNITCDSWYASIPLAEELLKKKLTLVGALRNDKDELPVEFIQQQKPGSSLFGFHHKQPMTLVTYCKNKNKNVLLLSSMHHNDDSIIETKSGTLKPEILQFYNLTKSGVDTAQKMCNVYSSSKLCNRWPLRIFFHLINTAEVNAFVLNYTALPNSKKLPKFIEEIGLSLLQSHINHKEQCSNLSGSVKKILDPSTNKEGTKISKRGRCVLCPRMKDIKTASSCFSCKGFMCLKHMYSVCPQCYDKD